MKSLAPPPYREDRSPGYENTFIRTEARFWNTPHPVSGLLWPGVYESARRGSWSLRRINFPCFRAELMLEGELCYEVNGVRTLSRTGDLHLTPPGGDVLLIGNPRRPCRRIGMDLYGAWQGVLLESLQLTGPCNLPAGTGDFEPYLRELQRLLGERSAGTEPRIAALCLEFLLVLGGLSAAERTPPLPERLTAALNFLHSHPGTPTAAAELARRAGCSVPTLTRLFRKHLGSSPAAYAAGCRLDHARQLLEFGEASVKEIAAELGYRNAFHFSRAFRGKFGVPPSRWRQSRYGG